RVRLLPAGPNLGGVPNFMRTFRDCRGRYVALLDGDDYWTNPQKLQLQVDFLDSHPKIAICFHNATAIEEGTGASGLYCPPDQKRISTIADLWVRNFIPTCSAVVRRALVPELPEWFRTATFGDWPLYVLYALRGDIAYLPEVMATYRVHRGGAWSGQ